MFSDQPQPEVVRSFIEYALRGDTGALRKLFPHGPFISPTKFKKLQKASSSFTYTDHQIATIFSSIKKSPDATAVSALNEIAKRYFFLEALFKPPTEGSGRTIPFNRRRLMTSIIDVICFLQNFDLRWPIDYDAALFSRLEKDLRRLYENFELNCDRQQKSYSKRRPPETARSFFICELATIYREITGKEAKSPAKYRGKKAKDYEGPFFRFVEACYAGPIEPIQEVALAKAIKKALSTTTE